MRRGFSRDSPIPNVCRERNISLGRLIVAFELYQSISVIYPWNLPLGNWQDSGYSLNEFALLDVSTDTYMTIFFECMTSWQENWWFNHYLGLACVSIPNRDCTHSKESKLTLGVLGWILGALVGLGSLEKTGCFAPNGSSLSPGGECCITKADDDAGDQGAPPWSPRSQHSPERSSGDAPLHHEEGGRSRTIIDLGVS